MVCRLASVPHCCFHALISSGQHIVNPRDAAYPMVRMRYGAEISSKDNGCVGERERHVVDSVVNRERNL